MAKTKEIKTPEKASKSAPPSTKETKSKKAKEVEAKPILGKVPVTFRQIGKNLNVVVGNEKFTRVGSKEELDIVRDSIKAYDAKPTKSNQEAMMKALRPETAKKEAEIEKVKADIKATKKKVEEKKIEVNKKKTNIKEVIAEIDDKLMSTEELDEMEKAIKRQREKIAPVAKVNPTPRGGESYRR